MEENYYHEHQHLQFCAVHSMNNLFQDGTACSKQQLDAICRELNPHSLINPHKSILGIGNYDINVIMTFLSERGYDTVWFDVRKSVESIDLSNVFGILMNRTRTVKVLSKLVTVPFLKHWYVMRKLKDDNYYNLDSKLTEPSYIGDEVKFRALLTSELKKGVSHLLLVVTKEVSESRAWCVEET